MQRCALASPRVICSSTWPCCSSGFACTAPPPIRRYPHQPLIMWQQKKSTPQPGRPPMGRAGVQGPPRQWSMRLWSGLNPLPTPHSTAWVRLVTLILR